MGSDRERAHRRRDELLVDVHPYEDEAVRFVLDGLGVASLGELAALVASARAVGAPLAPSDVPTLVPANPPAPQPEGGP